MLGFGIAMWQICCTTSCRIVVSLSVGGVVYNMTVADVRVVEFGTKAVLRHRQFFYGSTVKCRQLCLHGVKPGGVKGVDRDTGDTASGSTAAASAVASACTAMIPSGKSSQAVWSSRRRMSVRRIWRIMKRETHYQQPVR